MKDLPAGQTDRWHRNLVSSIAVAMALFQIYTGAFGNFTSYLQRSFHLTFALVLITLSYPLLRRANTRLQRGIELVSLGLVFLSIGYVVKNSDYLLSQRFQFVEAVAWWEILLGFILVVLVLDATRRVTGWALPVIASVFLLYPFISHLPGILGHKGYSLADATYAQYLTTMGIFGIPLGASANYIALFIIFGAFLERSGLGQFIMDISLSLAGRYRGGPAKVAVLGSALTGTISGSAPANVLTTGTLTIPLMKRVGFPAHYAGAVEAAASTGGVIMPPLMGSVAFLMSQYTGLPYIQIAKHALIPAMLYFFGILLAVHWAAGRMGLKGLPPEEISPIWDSLRRRGHLLLPIALLLYLLVKGYTPQFSVVYSLVSVVIVAAFRKETRMGWRKILEALEAGAKSSLLVAIATATAGMIVGVMELTGVGIRLAQSASGIVGDQLLLGLVLTMLVTLILGLGVPPSAAYIVQVAVTIPMLISILVVQGTPQSTAILVAHFFVLYFSALAVLTPPDALASIAAAGVAKADFIPTALTASRIAFVAYIIPFMAVFRPGLLLVGTWQQILISLGIAVVGVFAMSVFFEGYFRRHLNPGERLLALVAGIGLIFPDRFADLVGVGALVLLLLSQFLLPGKGTGAARVDAPVHNK